MDENDKNARDAERVGDLLNGLVAFLELVGMAFHGPAPEYVECRECLFWRGGSGERMDNHGRLLPELRACRRHAADTQVPGDDLCITRKDHGCGEGVRRPTPPATPEEGR